MANPDSEGYTSDSPLGAYVLSDYWDDYKGSTQEDTITWAIVQGGVSAYMTAHSNVDGDDDPFFQGLPVTYPGPQQTGLDQFFKRVLEINYRQQVTGFNLEFINGETKASIVAQMKRNGTVSTFTDDQAIWGFSMFLSPTGDYSAQLASQNPNGGYVTNPKGDVLRLKYITHGNYIRFSVSLDFFGQLLDGLVGIFSGGPGFSVSFDTVTTIDLQLPHRSSDGFRVIYAALQNAGAKVHSETLDADQILAGLPWVGPSMERGVNETPPQDLTGKLNAQLQPMSSLLGQAKFDQADYMIAGEFGESVEMKFTQHPYRDFILTIDYIQDLFPGQVDNLVKAQIGVPGAREEVQLVQSLGLEFYRPIGRHYSDGTRFVLMDIQLWRQFIHGTVVGHLVKLGGSWYIVYGDPYPPLKLPPDFDPTTSKIPLIKANPPPPGKQGLILQIDLYADYALQTITGRYPNSSIFKVKSGQQIRIPGDSIQPEIWFTVTMYGTRNGAVPLDAQPSDPPRPGKTAVYVGG